MPSENDSMACDSFPIRVDPNHFKRMSKVEGPKVQGLGRRPAGRRREAARSRGDGQSSQVRRPSVEDGKPVEGRAEGRLGRHEPHGRPSQVEAKTSNVEGSKIKDPTSKVRA